MRPPATCTTTSPNHLSSCEWSVSAPGARPPSPPAPSWESLQLCFSSLLHGSFFLHFSNNTQPCCAISYLRMNFAWTHTFLELLPHFSVSLYGLTPQKSFISTSFSHFFSLNTLQSSFFFLHHSKTKQNETEKTPVLLGSPITGACFTSFCSDQSWFMLVS